MAEKRLFKEYNQLAKTGPENPQIVRLAPTDPTDVFSWDAVICKPDKNASPYYYNGQWKLEVKVGPAYPLAPPNIKFSSSTPISHPNIDIESGEICLDILKSENWSPAWNLHHLVVAILVLLDDPEPDSPLNIDAANLFRHDKTAFESFVQYTIWKNGNFYDGERLVSGVKKGGEEDEPGWKTSALAQSAWVDVGTDMSSTLKSGVAEDVAENVNLIKNVGQQVTQEFLDKAYEVQHSHSSSADDSVLDNATQAITDTVKKQVDQLCVKTVSPPAPGDAQSDPTAEPKSPEYEEERRNFIKQVDATIQRITSPNTQSIEPVSTTPSVNSSVGSLKRSTSIKKPSSLSDAVDKPKKSKRKMLKKLVKRESKE